MSNTMGEGGMRNLIIGMVVVLLIAHQDFWFWNDPTPVFGFIPIGLFYHACISLAAGFVWFLACNLAWPAELDEFEEAHPPQQEVH